jgi:membrane-bound lytic murein transglycosylase MltF
VKLLLKILGKWLNIPSKLSFAAREGYSVINRAAVSTFALRLLWLCVALASTTVSQQLSSPATVKGPGSFPPRVPLSASEPAISAPFGRHTDDLDAMVKRQNIRALVIVNPIGFFYDNGQPMGVMYDALRSLENYVNERLRTGALKVQVTFIPVAPNQIETALTQGIGDLIAYALVISPERAQQVAFTVPLETDVKQVLVSGPSFGKVTSLEDLDGKEVYVNPLSTIYPSLRQVNATLQKAGKKPIEVKAADDYLLDDDLVEMVNAQMIPATVTTLLKAQLWAQVLPHITVHPDLVIASGEQSAWAVRKNNPQLKQLLDGFIGPRAVGTSFGNTMLRRYVESDVWIKNATSPDEMKKFTALSGWFQEYAGQYDFDYLMIMAVGYQESQLDQRRLGPGGAVGIMQVLPSDAAAPPINIANVNTAPNNILAGVRILHQIEEQYLNDPAIDPLNKTLLAFASYNAGPNRIAELRARAKQEGLDPNKWFENVEVIVAREIGEVTVTYVGNVYKYYVAYKLALGQPEHQ